MKSDEPKTSFELLPDDLELVSYLLEGEGLAGAVESPIRPRSESDERQLSFAQQRLWFIDQLDPGKATYNIPFAVSLKGSLDVTTLERAFGEIIRRHEVLRTTFVAHGGQPSLVVDSPSKYRFETFDLRAIPEHERRLEAQRLATEEAQRPFDLMRGPLLRAELLRVDNDEHIVLVTLHHTVSDGWSTGVLIRESAIFYEAFLSGRSAPLQDLPIQYSDFAAWQRERLNGRLLEDQLAYWRNQLEDRPPILELPTDRPRPPVQTYRGRKRMFAIDGDLRVELRSLGRSEGATLFMTLFAAFASLLHRYSGQYDFTVGTPVAGRNRAETENLIGFFVNTLVLRADISGEPSFRELLHRVRETILGALAHQELPFQHLVELLQPDRDLSHTPMFQVWFVLQNAPLAPLEFPGLTLTPMNVDSGVAQFDLMLDLSDNERGLSGLFMYNSDLFDQETIDRMIEHFVLLLKSAVEDPECPISNLNLLSPAEKERLVVEWNDTRTDIVRHHCAHEMFEEQAALHPDRIAVQAAAELVTYRELNRRANQLANYLRGFGVGPDVIVGVCLKRSVEMVVGILGVLKAGGAYLPLDPTRPIEHLAFLRSDSQSPLLVTQSDLQDALPSDASIAVCLNDDWDQISTASADNLSAFALTDSLAYLIYTSGSTGRPKGVAIEHRNLVNYLAWSSEAYKATHGGGAPVHSSIAFDLTVTSLFAPLVSGSSVTLVDEDQGLEGLSLVMRDSRDFSLIKITPAHLEVLSRLTPESQAAGKTRAMVIGGEALNWASLEFWRKHAPETRLINEYGPTETVVGCCVYEAGEEPHQGSGVPIGQSIANTQLYVLDHRGNLTGTGVYGELHIGGDGVGRGYLGRPDHTAEKFIPDPFGRRPGARLYSSGDIARRLVDGNIAFGGRVDQQLKLRGYRIEPAEIEAVLKDHPGVFESAVILREDAPGDSRLIGYVAADSEHKPSVDELIRHLKRRLPEYEVPSALVVLDSIPLTANGKVDLEALPEPPSRTYNVEWSYVAPGTEVEIRLAQIFAEVLRAEMVGVHDNFFDLGGHSLLAVQVISRVRETFGVEIQVRELFEAPTIAGVAKNIERESRVEREAALPLRPAPRDELLPLSFAQQRLWFVHEMDPLSPAYNIPVAVRMTGVLDVSVLERTLNELIKRHESLRTAFEVVNGRLVQVIGSPESTKLEVTDLRETPDLVREQQALRIAMQEAQRPFDLTRGPLLRAELLRLADEEHIILLTLHHIISDGWSTGVLVREVAALYQAFLEEPESPLPALPIQYADFAVWQRQWLQGEVLEEQSGYWRGQLSGKLEVLELPTDRPRPPVQTYRASRRTFVLHEKLREKLVAVGRAEKATLFMTLFAAFASLLHRYSGQSDFAVATPVAGRNRAETENLIGFFVNTLILRAGVSGDDSFRTLLRGVCERTLGALAHQDLPFEKLVEELQPARDARRPPLAQVFFTLDPPPRDALKLPGLVLTPMEADSGTVKYDLVLNAIDSGRELHAALVYNVDLFDDDTIARMTNHFVTLVNGIVTNPDEPVARLAMLTDAEIRQLLVDWNDTRTELPSATVHELFEAQVRTSPEAPAVICRSEQLNFADLNRRANQVARHLRFLGVGPEDRVGLCIGRSIEMVIGLLGILKAGGAYVPLDPAYPQERLAYMIENSHVSSILSQQTTRDALPPTKAEIICIEAAWDEISGYPDGNLDVSVTPQNLAYVIYTSGSTGMSKGVMIEHLGLCNLARAQIQAFEVKSDSRVLQFASLSFDASVSEVFMALLSGAALYLEPPASLLPGPPLSDALYRNAITTVTLPPALLTAIPFEEFPNLRTIIAAGEACPADVVEKWSRNRTFLNAYGPTEVTVCATIARCVDDSQKPPIGRPIANTRVYVLDQFLQPTPVGVPGELCVSGVGLARGYHLEPELSATKFTPDPFSGATGSRLYRTGDLARYRPDGQVEFIGRHDHQVKVRGFRIELGEIENVLKKHGGVTEAAVVVREDAPGDKRIAAYVVPAEPAPEVTELRSHLQLNLPEYMIPSAFVMLKELPLNANGKIDRSALPRPDLSQRPAASQEVPPRTSHERTLAAIWEDVLHVGKVGVNDNFFELGGHSLLIVEVRAKLQQILGQDISIAELFQYPTISSLGRYLERQLGIKLEPEEEEAPRQRLRPRRANPRERSIPARRSARKFKEEDKEYEPQL